MCWDGSKGIVVETGSFTVKEGTDSGRPQSPGFPAAYYASLLGGLIHRSNNLLTVLSGHSGLLFLEPNLSDEVLQPVRRMAQATETLSRCLDEAGAASKETVLFFEPIVFRDFFKTLAFPPGMEVKNNCDNNLTLLGDRRKLKETFEQILRNAVEAKATFETITSKKDPPTVRLSFRDNGHGIKAEVMPRIFDPFFTTRTQQGLFGLGLFRARGELARMNGEILATSDGKTYTEVSVRIPFA